MSGLGGRPVVEQITTGYLLNASRGSLYLGVGATAFDLACRPFNS